MLIKLEPTKLVLILLLLQYLLFAYEEIKELIHNNTKIEVVVLLSQVLYFLAALVIMVSLIWGFPYSIQMLYIFAPNDLPITRRPEQTA